MENTTTKSTGIVARIVNLLKLGHEGKIGSFFERLRKNLKREIDTHKRNKETIIWNNQRNVEALTEKLEDAKDALVAAYMNVDTTKIENNASQESYEKTYWNAIEFKEEVVEGIKFELERTEKDFIQSIKYVDAQIAELEYRFEQIA